MPVADSYRWVRIDDRLLHGQVALGWRSALDPESFVIVDDGAASDPFAAVIFEGALPEGTSLSMRTVDAFLASGHRTDWDPERTVLLLRSLDTMERLWDGGFRPRQVNLGGLHARPGARRLLDYLFVTDDDIRVLRRLADEGLGFLIQDLPHAARHPLAGLLPARRADA